MTAPNAAPEAFPAKNQVTPRLPPVPVDDVKLVLRPRGGIRLIQWAHHVGPRTHCMAAGLPKKAVNLLLFRIQAERSIVIANTPDATIGKKLQAITGLNLGWHRYKSPSYITTTDNYCKGVIIGLEKNTLPTKLLNNICATDVESCTPR
ncbi:hypothetical protein MRX96_036067 [Rhipicephalus microplus]